MNNRVLLEHVVNQAKVEASAMEARLSPDRYLAGYPDMLLDAETAVVTPRDFERLSEYSTSVPTGVYFGKCWKRGEGVIWSEGKQRLYPGRTSAPPNWMRYSEVLIAVDWYLGFYSQCDPPEEGYSLTNWRRLEVADA